MTGRQRLLAVLHRRPLDRLAWATLIDPISVSGMPDEVRALHPFDFYRRIGADVFTFGNYGLPREDCVPSPAQRVCEDLCESWQPGPNRTARHQRDFRGRTLLTLFENDHPVRHPVQSLQDLHLLRHLWEATAYVERPDAAAAFARTEARIGDDGFYLPTMEPSPVQQLIEYEMGPAGFYYFLQDHPDDTRALLRVMHEKRTQEYDLMGRLTPAPAVMPVENTSTTLISPDLYREHSLPQIRDYADILHGHGKKIVLHMCGHLKALLPVLGEVGGDAFNATTPPPVGSATYEDVLDAYGDDFVLFGAILDPTVLHKPGVTPAEIHACLDRLYTPRLRRAHLLLVLGVDGLPTPLERFLAVRDWMNTRGQAG